MNYEDKKMLVFGYMQRLTTSVTTKYHRGRSCCEKNGRRGWLTEAMYAWLSSNFDTIVVFNWN